MCKNLRKPARKEGCNADYYNDNKKIEMAISARRRDLPSARGAGGIQTSSSAPASGLGVYMSPAALRAAAQTWLAEYAADTRTDPKSDNNNSNVTSARRPVASIASAHKKGVLHGPHSLQPYGFEDPLEAGAQSTAKILLHPIHSDRAAEEQTYLKQKEKAARVANKFYLRNLHPHPHHHGAATAVHEQQKATAPGAEKVHQSPSSSKPSNNLPSDKARIRRRSKSKSPKQKTTETHGVEHKSAPIAAEKKTVSPSSTAPELQLTAAAAVVVVSDGTFDEQEQKREEEQRQAEASATRPQLQDGTDRIAVGQQPPEKDEEAEL